MSNLVNSNDEFVKKFGNWDYYFEQVKTNPDITEPDKAEILKGFQALREIMGDAWFEETARSHYPIFHRLANLVSYSQLSVARVGLRLQALKSAKNFNKLRRRMMSRDTYSASEAELEVASYFAKAGFSIEFYPAVGSKEADLLLIRDNMEYYVEVTVIGDSVEERRAFETLEGIHWPYFAEDIIMHGRVLKILSTPHLEELKKRIANVVEEVKNTHEGREVVDPGVVQLFICPRDNTDALKVWQKRKGISGLEGPRIEVNEISRIRHRLDAENSQLPEDKPGLIIVYGRSLREQFFEPNFYEKLASQLEETVYGHRNLILGAIVTYGSDLLTHPLKEGRNYILRHRQYGSRIGDDVLIIKNRFSKFAVDEDIIQALLND